MSRRKNKNGPLPGSRTEKGFWRKISDRYIENRRHNTRQFLKWEWGGGEEAAQGRTCHLMYLWEQHLPCHEANTEHCVLNIAAVHLTVRWESGMYVCARETHPYLSW